MTRHPKMGAAEQRWLLYRNHREITYTYDQLIPAPTPQAAANAVTAVAAVAIIIIAIILLPAGI